MNGKKRQGPLAHFGPDAAPSDEDVPLGEELPEGIEEKVLEEIGSLQFKTIMKRLDGIEGQLKEIIGVLATSPHLQKDKGGKE